MELSTLVPLIPIAAFWACFSSTVAACKQAHEQKERLIRQDFPHEYAAILRADTLSLCVGVVLALLVFAATLGWLAFVLWKYSHGASVLVALEAAFAGLAAWMFLEGTLRFFRHIGVHEALGVKQGSGGRATADAAPAK